MHKIILVILLAVKKGKAIARVKPFPSVKPPTQQQATNQMPPNQSASNSVGSQSMSSKDINDIGNDFLQKQSSLQPIKPQSTF